MIERHLPNSKYSSLSWSSRWNGKEFTVLEFDLSPRESLLACASVTGKFTSRVEKAWSVGNLGRFNYRLVIDCSINVPLGVTLLSLPSLLRRPFIKRGEDAIVESDGNLSVFLSLYFSVVNLKLARKDPPEQSL